MRNQHTEDFFVYVQSKFYAQSVFGAKRFYAQSVFNETLKAKPPQPGDCQEVYDDGEEFMWDCLVILQTIATQGFTQCSQSWKVQKSTLGQNGKSKSFVEQNQPSKMRKN